MARGTTSRSLLLGWAGLAVAALLVVLVGAAGGQQEPGATEVVKDFPEDLADTTGFQEVEAVEGRAAAGWPGAAQAHGTPGSLTFLEPQDWAAWDELAIDMHSAVATEAVFVVRVETRTESPFRYNEFRYGVVVAWTGWEEVRLPLRGFTRVGWPRWESVTSFSLVSSGLPTCAPKPNTQLSVGPLRLVRATEAVTVLGAFEEPETEPWTGINVVQDPTHSGVGAARYDIQPHQWAYAWTAASDWTRYEALSFWAYSPEPTAGVLEVWAHSEVGEPKKGAFISALSPNWTGWRQIVIPRTAFMCGPAPVEWEKITRVIFEPTRGWAPGAHLVLDDVALLERAPQIGEVPDDGQGRRLADFKELSHFWAGVMPEANGDGSAIGVWDTAVSEAVWCYCTGGDLTAFDTLELEAKSATDLGEPLGLLLVSNSPDTEALDAYLAHQVLPTDKATKLRIPFSSFLPVGNPGPQSEIPCLILVAPADTACRVEITGASLLMTGEGGSLQQPPPRPAPEP